MECNHLSTALLATLSLDSHLSRAIVFFIQIISKGHTIVFGTCANRPLRCSFKFPVTLNCTHIWCLMFSFNFGHCCALCYTLYAQLSQTGFHRSASVGRENDCEWQYTLIYTVYDRHVNPFSQFQRQRLIYHVNTVTLE